MPRVLDGGMCLVALLVPPPLVGQHGVPAPDGAHVTMVSLDPRFDRIVPASTGREFAEIMGEKVHWVLGGHSWMIPRPAIQLAHWFEISWNWRCV